MRAPLLLKSFERVSGPIIDDAWSIDGSEMLFPLVACVFVNFERSCKGNTYVRHTFTLVAHRCFTRLIVQSANRFAATPPGECLK